MVGKKEKRSVVPWFSMAEWEQAYKDLYSMDTESQTRGYERLLVWKARVPILPASIECTLGLIQVCLRDRDETPRIQAGRLPAYAEHDLRLMYSTSIMRFLNHLSSIAQNADETLFSMAKKLYIPEWLVSLRHDCAHGASLPTLELLRSAAHIALDWLHEHYWRSEGDTTSDWIVEDTSHEQDESATDLSELMDSWQALKLHALGGYTRVKDLPDTELRTYIKELVKGGPEIQPNIILLFRTLMKAIRSKYKNRNSDMEELINIIVTRESFFPSPDCIKLLNDSLQERPERDCLPVWLFGLWKELLTSLHKSYSVLSLLVCTLLGITNDETVGSHRRHMAALWVKELCRGLEKGREVLRRVNQLERRNHSTVLNKKFRKTVTFKTKSKKAPVPELSRKKALKTIKRKLEEDDPRWKSALCLDGDEASGSVCSKTELKQAVMQPNAYTHLFLSSLIEVMEPPLPPPVKENLVSLVRIYIRTDSPREPVAGPVHTVEELKGTSEDMEVVVVEENDSVTPTVNADSWARCEDDVQWAQCPLGILPWQRGKDVTFDMPRDITWQPLEPSTTHVDENKSLPGLFHQKINWKESLKKRPRGTKKRKLGTKCIQRAFDVVSVH